MRRAMPWIRDQVLGIRRACPGHRQRVQARAGRAQARQLVLVQHAVVHLPAPGLLDAQAAQRRAAAAHRRIRSRARAAAGPTRGPQLAGHSWVCRRSWCLPGSDRPAVNAAGLPQEQLTARLNNCLHHLSLGSLGRLGR